MTKQRFFEELTKLQVGEMLKVNENVEITRTSETGTWFGGGTQWAPIEGPEFHALINDSDEDLDSGDYILQNGALWRMPGGSRFHIEEFLEG